MSTTQWIILAVVIILALLLIAAIMAFTKKRKTEQQRAHAEELRSRAATQAPNLHRVPAPGPGGRGRRPPPSAPRPSVPSTRRSRRGRATPWSRPARRTRCARPTGSTPT